MGVEALSQAKDLKTITWLVMSSSAQEGLPVTQPGSFEALQSLDLAFKFPEFPAPKLSQAIIESFDHQRLRRLCLQHIGRITADEFYDLLVAISRSCNPHALQTLVIRRREGDLLSCVDWPLYLSHLVLLAEFKQLQMLVLDVARGVILDQKECQAVAKWWPKLRTLRLSSVSDKARRSPTPLACVAVFAEKCADLETLALAVDTRSIQWPWQRPEPGEPLPSRSWVTTLDLGDSTIDPYSVNEVVDFLARTLPCLRRILHSSIDEQQSHAWDEVARRVLESTAPDDGEPDLRRLSSRETSVERLSIAEGSTPAPSTLQQPLPITAAPKVETVERQTSRIDTSQASLPKKPHPIPASPNASPEAANLAQPQRDRQADAAPSAPTAPPDLTAPLASATYIAELESKNRVLEQRKRDLDQRCTDLEKRSADLEAKHVILERKHTKLGRRYQTMDQRLNLENRELQLRHVELAMQKNEIATQRDELAERADELGRQNDQLTLQRDELARQKDQLARAHADVEEQTEKQQKRILMLERQREPPAQAPAPPSPSVDPGLARKLSVMERLKDELAAQKDHLSRAHAALEEQSEEQQKRILELERRLEEPMLIPAPTSTSSGDSGLAQKLSAAKREKDELQARYNAMLKHTREVVARSKVTEQEKRQLEQANGEHKRQLEQQKEQKRQLERAHELQRRAIEQSNEQLKQRCAKLERWQGDMQRGIQDLARLSGGPPRGLSG
ncbi:uncharacterized protein SCHCODRAFT_02638241 [Schizophyllum commune H4-8]|uniref:uncharacterized protein n=1 Tax=Schizophyllum commune (strain H4-8 / FGSC 9210) TaxID=578458 RepID=UPI00215FBC64|nr:uncharacterized protein SCHCODRAFT_02638241 [Schizophyllum commune H4-8]KAI5887482.1 hypothetical protein SCHCODRAFT_02638241 [Schizophyllum commune H4-8]